MIKSIYFFEFMLKLEILGIIFFSGLCLGLLFQMTQSKK